MKRLPDPGVFLYQPVGEVHMEMSGVGIDGDDEIFVKGDQDFAMVRGDIQAGVAGDVFVPGDFAGGFVVVEDEQPDEIVQGRAVVLVPARDRVFLCEDDAAD